MSTLAPTTPQSPQHRRPATLVLIRSLLLLATLAAAAPGWAQRTAAVAEAPPTLAIPDTDEGLPGAGPLRRADWFRQLWLERRQRWAESAQQDQGALVLLGDSITQGWGDDLSERFPGAKVVNRGISGDTTRGVLVRLAGDVLALKPAGVVLLIGTNDLEEQAEPVTIAANMKLILAELRQHNAELPVVLCAVFPSSASMRRPSDKIQELNKLYAQLVLDDPHVTLVDTWTLFANSQGDANPAEFPDLLHLNEAGYAKWATALRPVLETRGLLPAPQDEFVVEDGFQSLFNGRDLTGWCWRPTSPEDLKAREGWRKSDPAAPPWPVITERVSFDGKTSTPDGRFIARNGRLIVTTPAEGRRIQQIWTDADFEGDFILKLEFRAGPNADSGVFLRKPQLQCRDYVLAGPYKNLSGYRPQDWNELIVEVKQGKARCTCNGQVLEEALELPASGPIGLEGDRGQMEYRRIRIQRSK